MSVVDWSHTEQIMHIALPDRWQPTYPFFQKDNKRFVEDFIPGDEHDGLRLHMLLGYGTGLDEIRHERGLYPTQDVLYFYAAFEPLKVATASIAQTCDTDKASAMGHDYAFWSFQQHSRQIIYPRLIGETAADREKLDDLVYDKAHNFYYLFELMQKNHNSHSKPAQNPVTLAA